MAKPNLNRHVPVVERPMRLAATLETLVRFQPGTPISMSEKLLSFMLLNGKKRLKQEQEIERFMDEAGFYSRDEEDDGDSEPSDWDEIE